MAGVGPYGDSQRWFPALSHLPFWVQAALAVWAFDFAVYWRHRLEHAFAALWAFHAVHPLPFLAARIAALRRQAATGSTS